MKSVKAIVTLEFDYTESVQEIEEDWLGPLSEEQIRNFVIFCLTEDIGDFLCEDEIASKLTLTIGE